MNRTVAAVAVLGLLATTSCASHNRGARPTASTTRPSATAASPSPSPSPSPTEGPLLTTQPMTAADGRKTSACRDGSCEVLVSAGTRFRFTHANGDGMLSVDSVTADGITVTFVAGVSGSVSSGPRQGSFATINGVSFVAVAVRGTSGVLRLVQSG